MTPLAALSIIGAALVGGWLLRRIGIGTPSSATRPAAVPAAVWEYWTDVRGIAREIDYPWDPSWALAILWQESTGRPRAQGSSGEVGLMQMRQVALEDVRDQMPAELTRGMPRTTGELLAAEPRRQIRAGMLFHKLQGRRCGGDVSCATRAYNAGYSGRSSGSSYLQEVRRKRDLIR